MSDVSKLGCGLQAAAVSFRRLQTTRAHAPHGYAHPAPAKGKHSAMPMCIQLARLASTSPGHAQVAHSRCMIQLGMDAPTHPERGAAGLGSQGRADRCHLAPDVGQVAAGEEQKVWGR